MLFQRGITSQVWPTTSPSLKQQINNNKSNVLPSDLIGGPVLEHSSLGDQVTVPQEKSQSGDVCRPPDESCFLCTLLGSPLYREEGRPSREGLGYGSPRDPAPASPNPGLREGRRESTPHSRPPPPQHRKKPTTQTPKAGDGQMASWGSISQVGTLGLSIALNSSGPAESPLKPLVLKLVRCLVLINELQIPHP